MPGATEWDQLNGVVYDSEEQALDARFQVPGVRCQGGKIKVHGPEPEARTFLKMPGTVILAPDFWPLSPAFCINCADGGDKNYEGWVS